jgi:hypothetical protein
MLDSRGNQFARYMNKEIFIDITLEKELKVKEISEPYAHGYSDIPLVPVFPHIFSDSQISPIASAQAVLTNQLSRLTEEEVNNTFTRWFLSGVGAEDESTETGAEKAFFKVGTGKIVVLPYDPDVGNQVKVERIGGDIPQADSIRKNIADTENNLYRVAGLAAPDPLKNSGPAESGIAKAIKFQDSEVIMKSLSRACESAENQILKLIAEKEGSRWEPSNYPIEFRTDNLQQELMKLKDVLSLSQLPAIVRAKEMKNFSLKNYTFTEAELADLRIQLRELE